MSFKKPIQFDTFGGSCFSPSYSPKFPAMLARERRWLRAARRTPAAAAMPQADKAAPVGLHARVIGLMVRMMH